MNLGLDPTQAAEVDAAVGLHCPECAAPKSGAYLVTVATVTGLASDGLGSALAMSGNGDLLIVARNAAPRTSVFSRQLDGGFCESQSLDVEVSGTQGIDLSSDGTWLVVATREGGIQTFSR